MSQLPNAYEGPIAALRDACARIGREVPRWTQGAGGNVSYKVGDTLWIKASGCRLDAVGEAAKTVARVALLPLREQLRPAPSQQEAPGPARPDAAAEQDYAQALASLSDPAFGRASMESGFHALLPRAFVAHFHALSALVMACVAKAAPARWAGFCETQHVGMPARLDFVRPGLLLSHAVHALPPFEICLLENHGVILHADGPDVLARWAAFEQAFCAAWGLSDLAAGGAPLPLQAYARGTWKIVFPDAAIFGDRVAALAQAPEKAVWEIVENAEMRDKAATELWIATQMLLRAWPGIAELSPDVAQALTHLPTELWRQQQHRAS